MKPQSLRPFLPRPALRRRLPRRLVPRLDIRPYAVQAPGAPTVEVFDRYAKFLQKERVASNTDVSRQVDYVRDEVAMRLVERLLDISRTFPRVLDLGAHACNIARALATPIVDPARPDDPPAPTASRIGHLVCAEPSPALLHRDADLPFNAEIALTRTALHPSAEHLPFEPESFDAVLSSLALHWANDLPGVLNQCHAALKPDSPLIGAMIGGDALFELRTSLQLASLERRGGLAAHTSPLADVRDVGSLLQRSGFKLVTVDVDDIVVGYPSVMALLGDLQAMGESSALRGRVGPIGRDVLLAAEGIYRELHGEVAEGEQHVSLPATFRVIYFIAWKEGTSTPQPLARGSGQLSIKDVLEGKTDGKGSGDDGGGVSGKS